MKQVVLRPSSAELPPGWTAAGLREAVEAAAAAWNQAAASCGVAVAVGEPIESGRAREDGANVVVFRGEVWCHDRRCGPDSTFPLGAAGITTVFPAGAVGRDVKEADIEVNALTYRWVRRGEALAAAAPPGGPRVRPLEGLLTHEIGHVLGLPDVCQEHRTSGRPRRVICSNEEEGSVMALVSADRRPSKADVATLCRLQADPVDAGSGPTRGCAPAGAVWLPLVCALAALAVAARRRLRRPPGRSVAPRR